LQDDQIGKWSQWTSFVRLQVSQPASQQVGQCGERPARILFAGCCCGGGTACEPATGARHNQQQWWPFALRPQLKPKPRVLAQIGAQIEGQAARMCVTSAALPQAQPRAETIRFS